MSHGENTEVLSRLGHRLPGRLVEAVSPLGTAEGALISLVPGGKGIARGCDLVGSGGRRHPLANLTLQRDQEETADGLAE